MKKLILKPNAFDRGEVLTRVQLRKVMGGTGSSDSGSSNYCLTHANCPSGSVCVFQFNSGDVAMGICCTSDDLHGTGPNPNSFCRN